jgi:Domain of unknown function (DUF4136)
MGITATCIQKPYWRLLPQMRQNVSTPTCLGNHLHQGETMNRQNRYRLTSNDTLRYAITGAFALLLCACSTLRVGSDHDPGANFSTYKTFTLMQRPHTGVNNPLVPVRVSDAIKADLLGKGYVLATEPATADFTVDFTLGVQERTDVDAYPEPYAARGWGWGTRGWWGGPYWGTAVDVRQYREGTLSVDIFDAHSHRPVWHGWAKKELTRSDIDNSTQTIQNAVASVLAKFPPT